MKTHRVYIFPEQLKQYEEGKLVVASTERMFDTDVILNVPSSEYGEVTHGGVLVRIRKNGFPID